MNQKNVNDIVNFIIKTEFEQFKQDFEDEPIPPSQDISSLAIEWLCYYCKEKVSLVNKNAIVNYVDEVMKTKDYETNGWCRIPALLAASYILTEREYYLDNLLKNLACHQSIDREFICKALSIICEIVPFSNEYFQCSVETNLIMHHGLHDISVILLLYSDGEYEVKEKWLSETLEIEELKSNRILNELSSGKSTTNDFFIETLNEIKSYILFAILKHSYSYNSQLDLFENRKVNPKVLIHYNDNHPLNKTKFEFRTNAE